MGFDPQRRRGRPPPGPVLRFEARRRLTGSGGRAVDVAGEQGGARDQHQRLGGVDVVALGLQAVHGSLGEDQRLFRQPRGEERLGAVREHGGAADTDRRVDLLGLVEAAERLHQVAAPGSQPRQVVAHVGHSLGPALGLEQVEGAP